MARELSWGDRGTVWCLCYNLKGAMWLDAENLKEIIVMLAEAGGIEIAKEAEGDRRGKSDAAKVFDTENQMLLKPDLCKRFFRTNRL